MAKIVLIGTSHKYQTGSDKAEAIEQFRHLLISLCSEHGVTAIAEEMNQAALAEVGVSKSIACVVAAELKLEHQLSDPLPEVREKLGIRAENDIRAQGICSNWTQEQFEAKVRKSHEIREKYWLDQLRILNSWPLLFVCGANHIEPFSALLRSNGFEVIVPFTDWKPNPPFHRTCAKSSAGQ
jgi:hypothetical protein